MPDSGVAAHLRANLRLLLWATLALYGFLVLVVAYVYIDSGRQRDSIERQADRTTLALCAFLADLERRVDSGEAFLRDNPQGFPGIDPEALQASLDNQRLTLASLGTLECK